jgi:hypothetical protein
VLDGFLQSLQATAVATAIREGDVLFPWIECIHVLALTLVLGCIAGVDLRLIGVASRESSIGQVTANALPLTWSAFVVAVISGGLLFASNAMTYAHNHYFQTKLVLLALAGANMAVYHLRPLGTAIQSGTLPHTPLRARVAGTVSLVLWIAIAASGRWIGFTLAAAT